MNRTTEIVLEYLSPRLAVEMMVRFHSSLPADEKERRAHLNQMHKELADQQQRVAELIASVRE